jgi:hypothetical protein
MRNAKRRYSRNTPHRRAQAATGATGAKQHSSKSTDPRFDASAKRSSERIQWIDFNEHLPDAVQSYIESGNKFTEKPGPLDRSLWIFKIKLSYEQEMVAFLAAGTIHIGFRNERFPNTSMPLSCPAEEIFTHIARNKGGKTITDEECVGAIKVLQFLIVVPEQIKNLSSDKLKEIADRLYRKWPALNQHRVTLAISGALAKAGYPQEQVESLFRAIYHDQNDTELKGVLEYVASAFHRYRQGKPALGLEVLKKEQHLNPRIIEELIELLSQ